jgi:hypothetical protein
MSLDARQRELRDRLLLSDEQALLSMLRVETFRGPGPGGQKRNKTSNGVRVTHEPTGLTGQAVETRSQEENRSLAIGRLRLAVALAIRCALDADAAIDADLRPKRPEFAVHVAIALDALEEYDYAVGEAARALGLTTGAFSDFLTRDDAVLNEVNRQRARRQLRPLRA